jgi:transposase
MKRTRMTFSQEFKIKAVELCNQRGNVSSVARELNVKRESLKRWKDDFNEGKFNTPDLSVKVKSKEEEELMLLKKELYDVKMERDILKKAVGIFSKSDR